MVISVDQSRSVNGKTKREESIDEWAMDVVRRSSDSGGE